MLESMLGILSAEIAKRPMLSLMHFTIPLFTNIGMSCLILQTWKGFFQALRSQNFFLELMSGSSPPHRWARFVTQYSFIVGHIDINYFSNEDMVLLYHRFKSEYNYMGVFKNVSRIRRAPRKSAGMTIGSSKKLCYFIFRWTWKLVRSMLWGKAFQKCNCKHFHKGPPRNAHSLPSCFFFLQQKSTIL